MISREDAIALVRRFEDAVNARDTSRLMDFYTEDAAMVSPVFGKVCGRAAIADSWDKIFSSFPDWNIRVSDVLIDGDRIAVLGTNTATDRAGWFGLPATGEPFSYRAVLILTLAGTKIVHEERHYDLGAVLEHLEKARVDRDLRTAAEVQGALLARTARVGRHYEALGDSVACRTIGGDFFDFFDLPSGDFGFLVGDVAGKGPAAALLAAMVQGMFTVESRVENRPSAVMSRVNRALLARGLASQFAALVYCVLSPDGRLIYSNAGHDSPILCAQDGTRRLTAGGPVLGASEEAAFEEETLYLNDGNVVVTFTDGVTEARNRRDEEFGEDRLVSCLTTCHAGSTPAIIQRILGTVRQFCEDAPQADDITVTVTRFHSQNR